MELPCSCKELPLVLVRGGGDLGSGTAYRLYVSGFPVVISELAAPRMVRRSVSFAEAVYTGEHLIEGVKAKLLTPEPPSLGRYYRQKWPTRLDFIPIIIDEGHLEELLDPGLVVDARMLKKNLPDTRRPGLCSIGLGPGFTAGENVDFAVETMRGHNLGRVFTSGSCLADTGVPGEVAGESARRLLRAPQEGLFRGVHQLGDLVAQGEIVGYVEDTPLRTAIAGQLRGLIRTGLRVRNGEKVGDVDPRGLSVSIDTFSDKARSVAGGVLEAAMRGLLTFNLHAD